MSKQSRLTKQFQPMDVRVAVNASLRRCSLRNDRAVTLFPHAEDMRTQAGFTDDHLDRISHCRKYRQ